LAGLTQSVNGSGRFKLAHELAERMLATAERAGDHATLCAAHTIFGRWTRLLGLIAPHYPKAGNGRQPLGMEKVLRIYFLQQWFNLSDPQAEDAIYDSESMRRFARVELGDEVVPDESTMLRFRHLLERHGLTQAIFDSIAGLLEERRLLLRAGTIVDATIIAAPSSTKNASATRDPEMKQTR
jgi:transposase, IS5 family